jgi:hypothetical protein
VRKKENLLHFNGKEYFGVRNSLSSSPPLFLRVVRRRKGIRENLTQTVFLPLKKSKRKAQNKAFRVLSAGRAHKVVFSLFVRKKVSCLRWKFLFCREKI